jgi:hypothetical protein
MRPVGASTFEQLVATHGGHASVALALVVGEVTRLRAYSNASAAFEDEDASFDNVLLPPDAPRMDPAVARAVDALTARHGNGMLAAGHALLADPARLFGVGAAPRETDGGAAGVLPPAYRAREG